MGKRYLLDKESLKQLSYELWHLRHDKNLLLRQVESRTGVPAEIEVFRRRVDRATRRKYQLKIRRACVNAKRFFDDVYTNSTRGEKPQATDKI